MKSIVIYIINISISRTNCFKYLEYLPIMDGTVSVQPISLFANTLNTIFFGTLFIFNRFRSVAIDIELRVCICMYTCRHVSWFHPLTKQS